MRSAATRRARCWPSSCSRSTPSRSSSSSTAWTCSSASRSPWWPPPSPGAGWWPPRSALSGNQAIFGLASKLGSPDFAGRWGPALAAPPIEETLKVLGVVCWSSSPATSSTRRSTGWSTARWSASGSRSSRTSSTASTRSRWPAATGDRSGARHLRRPRPRRAVEPRHLHRHRRLRRRLLRLPAGPQRRRPAARWPRACFAVAYSAHFIWNSPILTEAFGEGAGILLGLLLKGIPVARPAGRHVPPRPTAGGDVVPRRGGGRGGHATSSSARSWTSS